MLNGTVCLEFPIQQPGQVPTVSTHESLTVWSREMDCWKYERVTYQIGIQNFRSFGLVETQKFSFYPAAVLSRTNFSSLSMFKIP
jgi:hypothetical protein